MSGETLDVGIDTGAPVGPYPHRFPFTGAIDRVDIVLRDDLDQTARQEVEEGQLRGALRAQ